MPLGQRQRRINEDEAPHLANPQLEVLGTVGKTLPTSSSSGAGLRDLMARMGHDSERTAMIHQHEARGADQAITRAIDTHVQAEQANEDDDDGSADVLAPVG